MTLGFLRTRVGRRYLTVNLLSAFVPLLGVAGVSYTVVRQELRSQAEDRVTRLSKSLAMTTLASLTTLTRETATNRDMQVIGAAAPGARGKRETKGSVPRSLADTLTLRPLSQDETEHLAASRVLLVVAPPDTAGGDAEVLLGHQMGGGAAVTWRRATPAFLWSSTDEAMAGDDARYCLFESSTGTRIHCSPEATPAEINTALHRASSNQDGRRVDEVDGLFASTHDVYLTHEFAARPWRAVVLQPADISFAALAPFRRLLFFMMLGVTILMFLVSHAQIRRTTEPLAAIQAGTRRVQAGDFSTPVLVSSRDEYADVAQSFNTMAGALDRQLVVMGSLDAIDQSALAARDTNPVVLSALAQFRTLFQAGSIVIGIRPPGGEPNIQLSTQSESNAVVRVDAGLLSHADRSELEANSRSLVVDATRSWMSGHLTVADGQHIVIFPLMQERDLLGAVACVANATVSMSEYPWTHARRLADRLALALSSVQLVHRLDALSAGTLIAFARAIDANSPWTAGHSERVTAFAVALGRRLGLSSPQLDVLNRGALLHDIGKIAVPPAILDKSDRLSADEWATMKRHPVVGCEILAPIPGFEEALPLVRSHHEHMDGTGYPDGLAGEQIPLLARVLAVADVFDALTSDRPYRAGLDLEDACALIRTMSGPHLDPAIVPAFFDAVRDGEIHLPAPALDSTSLAVAVARARGSQLVTT